MELRKFRLAILVLVACFVLIGLDGSGVINIENFGYAAIGSLITLVLQYYFRKKSPVIEGAGQ